MHVVPSHADSGRRGGGRPGNLAESLTKPQDLHGRHLEGSTSPILTAESQVSTESTVQQDRPHSKHSWVQPQARPFPTQSHTNLENLAVHATSLCLSTTVRRASPDTHLFPGRSSLIAPGPGGGTPRALACSHAPAAGASRAAVTAGLQRVAPLAGCAPSPAPSTPRARDALCRPLRLPEPLP